MDTTVEPRMGWTVVIGGDGMYGKWGGGLNLATAKREFRNQGGKLGLGYTALFFDTDTEFLGVDQMGRVSWRGNEPVATEKAPR